MSTSSPRNARKDTKKTLAAKPATVLSATGKPRGAITLKLNQEPGHADRGLIRRKVTGIRMAPEAPAPKGVFGGVTKTERKRRKKLREGVARTALAEAA
jgi:hypothetical protein